MSIANRVIKNTIFLYVRMGVSVLVSVFTTRILLKALGASDYGLYNVVAGALSMLGFLSASMSSTTQRFISYAEGEGKFDKIKSIFNNALLLHWCIAGFVCVVFIFAGFVFFNGVLNIPEFRETTAIMVYGCLIFSTVFSITITPYDATLNAHENMLYYSLLGIFDVVLKLLIAIAVSYATDLDQLLFYGILMALESWFLRLITKFYCRQRYDECRGVDMRKYASKAIIFEMASFAGWNMVYIGASMIALYSMNIILNHYYGTVMNAAMGLAIQLVGVLMAVSNNMTKALTPVMVKKVGHGDREQMIAISLIGCRFSFLLFAAVCIPVLVSLPVVLKIWLGSYPDWTQIFCYLFIVSNLIEQLFVFLYQTILANGDIKHFSIWKSFFCLLPIAINIAMFEFGFPPYWLVLNWIIYVVIIGGIINIHYAIKIGLRMRNYLYGVLIPCLSSVLLLFPLCCLLHPSLEQSLIVQLFRLGFLVLCSLPIFWAVSISKEEKSKILNLVKK